MKDLIYSLASLIVGIILGVLSTIAALAGFGLWAYVESGKKKPRSKKESTYRGYSASQQSPPKDWKNVVLGTRKEVEGVIEVLRANVAEYGHVTVADFLATVGVESDFADYKWGWKTVVAAQVRPDKDGYSLWLPEPELVG